jgi:hypothetical protein
MIAKHETKLDPVDIWSALAAPLPPAVIAWRQDGRTISRDGKHLARFVAYIEANTVRERLDSVVPGEYDSTLELLPPIQGLDDDANQGACNFKCRLQILGVIREDVGTGKDYKQAATDAFKRAAVRFGIGHELYDYEQNWVQMDGDGKFARPIEDPAVAYARRYGRPRAVEGQQQPDPTRGSAPSASPQAGRSESVSPNSAPHSAETMRTTDEPSCPKCGGRTWDNRLTKRNPRAPDFKCRDRACDGVLWPEREDPRAVPNRPGDEPPHPADAEEIPF